MAGDASGDLIGTKLGNYRVESVLGQGGMSVMYRATDVRLGRKVALKVIGAHLGADAEFRERFVDEARNTSAIDHANIVPVYDFGELDGMLYIAMRLVDGSDLASRIGGEPMDPQRAVRLLEQVADALDTLHERGLVHLDMKPANVLVTGKEAAREHVYLADFGLTRRGATGHRTREGDFLGSPTYAAPEHLRGDPLDGRTDQYALACVAYACLTGTPPFVGEVSAVIKGHLHGQPAPVSRRAGLPAAVDEVVNTGMAKDPGERYGSCAELVSAVQAALSGPTRDGTGQTTARPAATGVGASMGERMSSPPQPGDDGSVGAAGGQPVPGQQPPGQHSPGQHPSGQQAPGQQPQAQQPQAQQPQAQQRPGQQRPGPPPGQQAPGQPPAGPQPPPGPSPGQPGVPGQPPGGQAQQTPAPGMPRTPPPGMGRPPTAGAGMGHASQAPPPQASPPQGAPPGPGGIPPPGYGQPPGDPWSNRAGGGGGKKPWIIGGAGVLLVIVAAVLVIVLVGSDSDSDSGSTSSETTTGSSAPDIPVGPNGSESNSPDDSGGDEPPESLPVDPDE